MEEKNYRIVEPVEKTSEVNNTIYNEENNSYESKKRQEYPDFSPFFNRAVKKLDDEENKRKIVFRDAYEEAEYMMNEMLEDDNSNKLEEQMNILKGFRRK